MIIPKVYYEKQESRFIDIGDVVFLSKEARILTTLGSCISVCLFSYHSRISAVCHAQMPKRKMKAPSCTPECTTSSSKDLYCDHNNKYVESVIPFMLNVFERKGVPRHLIRALVIGGASMLPALRTLNPIGILNAELACELLIKNDIKIVYRDTGGIVSRRIAIQNESGLVFVNKSLVYKLWDKQ